MIPFPHCGTYPLPPTAHPTRPWWTNSGSVWRRQQGAFFANSLEEMESLDTKYPIPFPGLRTGQIWLLDSLNCYTVGLLTSVLDKKEFSGIGGWSPYDIYRNSEYFAEKSEPFAWKFNNVELTIGKCRAIFEGGSQWTAFLLADPACPHLAPWGPAGAKKG